MSFNTYVIPLLCVCYWCSMCFGTISWSLSQHVFIHTSVFLHDIHVSIFALGWHFVFCTIQLTFKHSFWLFVVVPEFLLGYLVFGAIWLCGIAYVEVQHGSVVSSFPSTEMKRWFLPLVHLHLGIVNVYIIWWSTCTERYWECVQSMVSLMMCTEYLLCFCCVVQKYSTVLGIRAVSSMA